MRTEKKKTKKKERERKSKTYLPLRITTNLDQFIKRGRLGVTKTYGSWLINDTYKEEIH